MIAATNRPDILDSALLRPGRFDRQIMVPLPTQEERIDILKVHFRDKKIADDVNIEVVARGTPGMSGADLANLVNEAALFAVRRGETSVHREDFEDARDRVLMGLKRPTVVMNEEEKEHTAYHEGGHAVAAYVLEHADPVHKVTILPTGMALGMTQQLPEEEKYSHDKDFLDDMLSVLLGGACRGGAGLRVAVHRRAERPGARHRDRAPDGARVGHVRPHRSDGLGLAGRGVPRRGPRAHARLLRRDRPRHRRRGRAHPALAGGAHAGAAHEVPARPRSRGPARCSSTRRSTGSRSSGSSTTRWATAPAVRARSCSPTAPSRPSTTKAKRSTRTATRSRPISGQPTRHRSSERSGRA